MRSNEGFSGLPSALSVKGETWQGTILLRRLNKEVMQPLESSCGYDTMAIPLLLWG